MPRKSTKEKEEERINAQSNLKVESNPPQPKSNISLSETEVPSNALKKHREKKSTTPTEAIRNASISNDVANLSSNKINSDDNKSKKAKSNRKKTVDSIVIPIKSKSSSQNQFVTKSKSSVAQTLTIEDNDKSQKQVQRKTKGTGPTTQVEKSISTAIETKGSPKKKTKTEALVETQATLVNAGTKRTRKTTTKKAITEKTKEEETIETIPETEVVLAQSSKGESHITKPQVRYSDEDLEMFRKRILEVKNEALEELSMLKERLDDLNSYDLGEEGSIYSMHMAEQGSEIAEKEKVYAQIQRINEYIKKLDEALKRIDDKTYGICRVCGILIAKERLLAVPITTLSASYKIHKKCPEDGIDRIEPVSK